MTQESNRRMMLKGNAWPERVEVIVLAIVGTNAMVRRPGCMAFVASTKDLEEITAV